MNRTALHTSLQLLVALVLCLCLTGRTALAAAYDPDLDWRTLHTEHFNITFHQGEEQLADELAVIAERVWGILTEDMAHVPRRATEVVLVDHTDVANGYAMTLPVNTIVIFVTAPTESSGLSQYTNWLEMIFTHEYAHILHLDTVEGLPLLLRYTLGRVISTNQLSPWWLVEGQATLQETRHTDGGRGRSPHSDMILRMAVLEDDFPALGAMDGFMSGAPGGNTRYLFGQSFLDHIVRHSSDDAITRWIRTYGGWPIPYVLPAKGVFGSSFRSLYKDWRAELDERYQAQRDQVVELGLTTPQLLTNVDGSCYGATFSPAGDKLVWSCSDRATGSDIFLADGDGGEAEVILEERAAASFSWRPDGEAFAYASTHVVNDFNLYNDVYFHPLGTESTTRLTNGKRARDPAFSPDGSQLLVVRNKAQNNNLSILRIDQSLDDLTENRDHTQYSTPAWSPDGRYIAVSAWQDGKRDIWLYDAQGQPYRRLTMDSAIDRDPTWSADGQWLFFSSDRSGIYNIYAVDLETEALWQVTNVIGGAMQPSVRADFQVLTWQHYAANGYGVAMHPIEPSEWWPRGTLSRPLQHRGPLAQVIPGAEPDASDSAQTRVQLRYGSGVAGLAEAAGGQGGQIQLPGRGDQPGSSAMVDDFAEVDLEEEAEEDYPFTDPVTRYTPLPTLFPPRYALPSIYNTNYGLMGGLSTSGMDTLRQYSWSASITYRTDSKYLGGGAAFTVNRWRPVFSAGLNTFTVPYGDIYTAPEPGPGANIPAPSSINERYWDERWRVWASGSYSWRQRTAWYARYTGLLRQPQAELPKDVYEPNLPTRGFLSTVAVGWRYSRSQSFSYSISPEDARALAISAEWTSPYLGSYVLGDDTDGDGTADRQPFNQLQFTGEIREYITNPWIPNHVLALMGAGGVSFGDNLRYGSFRLGGNYGESSFTAQPDEWRSLRGFPTASDSGDGFYLGSVEYRFPIWRIDWGPGALPLFLRTLHGAAFTDFGDAFNSIDEVTIPQVGAGAELRLGVIAGWGINLNTRVGFATSVVGAGGYTPTDLEAWYFRIGTSF